MKIAHLADIHVQDRRRAEYKEVFEALAAQLAAARPAAIVIAGDVFDTMTRASAANWHDVGSLLSALSQVAPVVVIPGNHDLNVRSKDATDLLTPLFRSAGGARELDPARVQLWTKSGCHHHPLVPGVLWVIGAPSDDLPTPEEVKAALAAPDAPPVASVVGVFHETISGCRYPNGQVAETERFTPAYLAALARAAEGPASPLPFAALLGDVHLQQEVKCPAPNLAAAYPGSLVCQNLGEPHLGHGWLEWDLGATPPGIEPHEVPNEHAPYTAEIVGGEDRTALPRPKAPKVWRLRGDATTTVDQMRAHLASLTAYHARPPREVSHNRTVYPRPAPAAAGRAAPAAAGGAQEPAQEPAPGAAEEIAEAELWLAENEPDEGMRRAVVEQFRRDLSINASPTPARPEITRLAFSDMYCYGPDNVLDVEAIRAGPPGLVGLTAPNATGKSSLLDIIYLALTGAPMRGKKQVALREGARQYSMTLEFTLDGQKGRLGVGRSNQRHQTLTFEYDRKDLTGKDIRETQQTVRQYFGTPKHISQVSMYRPGVHPDFFSQTNEDQDALISDLLSLGHHAVMRKKLDEKYTSLRAAAKAISQLIEQALPGVATPKMTQAQKDAALVEAATAAVANLAEIDRRWKAMEPEYRARQERAAAATEAAAARARAVTEIEYHGIAAEHPAAATTADPQAVEALAGNPQALVEKCQQLAVVAAQKAAVDAELAAGATAAASGDPAEEERKLHELAAALQAAEQEQAVAASRLPRAPRPSAEYPAEALRRDAQRATGINPASIEAQIKAFEKRLASLDKKAAPAAGRPAAEIAAEWASAKEQRVEKTYAHQAARAALEAYKLAPHRAAAIETALAGPRAAGIAPTAPPTVAALESLLDEYAREAQPQGADPEATVEELTRLRAQQGRAPAAAYYESQQQDRAPACAQCQATQAMYSADLSGAGKQPVTEAHIAAARAAEARRAIRARMAGLYASYQARYEEVAAAEKAAAAAREAEAARESELAQEHEAAQRRDQALAELAEYQQIETRLSRLKAAWAAEAAREQLAEYEASAAWEAASARAAAARAAHASQKAAAATARAAAERQRKEAEQAKLAATRAALAAELGEVYASLKRSAAETEAARVAAQRASDEAEAAVAALRQRWGANKAAAEQSAAATQLQTIGAELKRVALYRAMLDPRKGLTPRLLVRARAEFLSAVNRRLAQADCDFRVTRSGTDYELEGTNPTAMPPSRDPALASGYQSFILELSARAALSEIAQVPLPSLMLIDEGFGCLDAQHLPQVAESLRVLSVDPPLGRRAPLVIAVTHRDDLTPAFAQRIELDHDPHRPTRLVWPRGKAAPRDQFAAPAGAPPGVCLPAAHPHREVGRVADDQAAGRSADGRCAVCEIAVAPGDINWVTHAETATHRAWIDPGLSGTRSSAQVSCTLCGKTFANGKSNWQTHVKTKGHQARLANRLQATQ